MSRDAPLPARSGLPKIERGEIDRLMKKHGLSVNQILKLVRVHGSDAKAIEAAAALQP
jgi:hypothetical protein